MLEPAGEKEGDNHPWEGRDSGEEAEREQSVGAVTVSSCSTIRLFSAQSVERNNRALKRLVLKDTINFVTDTSLVNVYKFPRITCRWKNYRL